MFLLCLLFLKKYLISDIIIIHFDVESSLGNFYGIFITILIVKLNFKCKNTAHNPIA